MELETKEPTHGTTHGNTLESLVNVYPLVTANAQVCAVHKTYPRTFTQQNLFDKEGKWYGYFFFKFYETVIGNYLGKQMTKVSAYFFLIEMFQATIAGIMEKNQMSIISAFDRVPLR